MSANLSNATIQTLLPLKSAPLVQCITNAVTIETMANALLYVGAKPIMADYPPEFEEVFQVTDSLVLNLGHLSPNRPEALISASAMAKAKQVQTVVDLVGVAATQLRFEVAQQLANDEPAVIKGNVSELRAFSGLANHGRGVDGNPLDQSTAALAELTAALKSLGAKHPHTTYLATGPTDVIVQDQTAIWLSNGVPEMDCFTGSGDILGAIIAALLGDQQAALPATVASVSYLNRCGETAKAQLKAPVGLADFRQQTLNQLSLLMQDNQWAQAIKEAVH